MARRFLAPVSQSNRENGESKQAKGRHTAQSECTAGARGRAEGVSFLTMVLALSGLRGAPRALLGYQDPLSVGARSGNHSISLRVQPPVVLPLWVGL